MNALSGLASQFCPATRALLPNRVRNFDGFHISYNAHSRDYGCSTTAMVLQGRVFMVLNGDHASPWIAAAERQGLQGCLNYFIEHLSEANALSEHRMAVALAADPFGLHATTVEAIGQGNVERIAALAGSQA